MLSSITVGHIKSFYDPQTLTLSEANGAKGSGYNVIVGANNSGKSNFISLVAQLLAPEQSLTIGREGRHASEKPVIKVGWSHTNGEIADVSIDPNADGAIFKKVGSYQGLHQSLRFVPSRRPFAPDYQIGGIMPSDYEHGDLISRRGNLGYFDTQLASAIARHFNDPSDKALFLAELQEIDPSSANFMTDNVGGRNVMLYEGPSRRPHVLSDTGDGITNLLRIVFALATSRQGDCLIIDEPELSLHPQIQRNLYQHLLSYSEDRQIIVVTHSPHFVGWKEISTSSRLCRVYVNQGGHSTVASPSASSFNAVRAHANITSRKFYDAVCKELFFADKALLVEGADDVHYLENYLDEVGAKPLPFMGYGCGGASAIVPWMRLCVEMGIKCAALFDGDKSEDYIKALAEFADQGDIARSYILFKDDIRDKHRRSDTGVETNEVLKEGVFNRRGKIHPQNSEALKALIETIRLYLN
ncbi:AAA family ATPase [Bradyrhizobium sp. 44]|uniref:ATP-dependent nuclease n=1 Tax=Bradyrhizobium sp. 44 TaxID=2782675 RepID=UPI001FFBE0BF|nr:AAA family ATPase [Bradyrhizobium sp. 44]MCK1284681.1 AAA family ATPase [Bradyrhizobium sp. 44]